MKAIWQEIILPMLQGFVRLVVGIIPAVDDDQMKQFAWRWNVAKSFALLFILMALVVTGVGIHIAEACGYLGGMGAPGFATTRDVDDKLDKKLSPMAQELRSMKWIVKSVAGSDAGRDLRDAVAQRCNLEKVAAKESDPNVQTQLRAVMQQLQNDVTKAQERYYKFMGTAPRTPLCSEL